MKIIIDECLPKRLIHFFTQHEVWTVPQIGLAGAKDSMLLDELDRRNIDLFITIDGNIEYQKAFENRVFATIVIRSASNRFEDLLTFKDELVDIIFTIKSGNIYHIPENF
ncbi:MAG: hypothetical protein U9R50_06480 [Campylobacterota bacterium]|nr:hypothetical protein [Campylobacterota bacterium]